MPTAVDHNASRGWSTWTVSPQGQEMPEIHGRRSSPSHAHLGVAEHERVTLINPSESRTSYEVPSEASSSSVFDEREQSVIMFGINLSRHFSHNGFCVIVFGVALSVSLLFAALQETVFHIPGFTYTGWMTSLQLMVYIACAVAEMKMLGNTRKGAWKDYLVLSCMAPVGIYATNWSLQYLSYSLRVMFKSAKILPVMALSSLWVGRRYGKKQYLGAVCLSLGIMLFSYGEGKQSGRGAADYRGIVLIVIALLADSLSSNFEEKRLLSKEVGATPAEVVLYASIPGLFWSLAIDWMKGSLWPAIEHSKQHPEVVTYIVGFSFFGYLSLNMVMLVIKHFGATVAECLKSARKLGTIALSFYLFSKPAGLYHVIGAGFFTASVALEFSHRRSKANEPNAKFKAKKQVMNKKGII